MVELGLLKFLTLALLILCCSFLGIILSNSNILITFICIEMMLVSINFIFIIYSKFLDDMLGQV